MGNTLNTDAIARKKRNERDKLFVQQLLHGAKEKGFYGKITLQIENGFVKRAVKEESVIPADVLDGRP